MPYLRAQNRYRNIARSGGRNDLGIIGETKRIKARLGEKIVRKEHGKYYEFHKSTSHDTIECTMLRREMENKMLVGHLNDLIKGLWSKQIDIIALIEPNIKCSRKNEIFMFR